MTRVLKTATLAACVLIARLATPAAAQTGAQTTGQTAAPAPASAQPAGQPAGQVAAQPIPPQGPAIDPAIYKVPAGAKQIAVDCDDPKQTLTNAVADKTAGDLNIVFSGTCKEHLVIQRDGVAIRGKDATAAVSGVIEVSSARRVLLEGFTCRDNTQFEFCIGASYGASVMLHNMKVFNSSVRGVEFYNSTGLVDGLTVDKTISTSMLIRASQVRLEGDLTFSTTVEGCLTIDNAASVFSKNGNFSARDCAAGILLQSNSNFYAPFATFNLNHNSSTGLMILTHGTFSYGGTLIAKNNVQTGIHVDDESSFAPFTNISGESSLTLENNGLAGISVVRGSYAELANVTAITGADYGVLVDDSRLRIGKSKISDNKKADVRLTFGAHAVFLEGASVGTLVCDGTELVKGNKTIPCTPDPKATPKPTATKQDSTQSQKR